MVKKDLCGLTSDEIFGLINKSGFTLAQAVSISNSVYKKGISDIARFVNIPARLREELQKISASGIISPLCSEVSNDKSVKYLFRTESGKEFETVYIPDNKRNTVCVSTQSGCRMGCSFCETAKYGFRGNLTAGEIINQIVAIPDADKVTHVVFMGMGEPMDNLENVLKACRIITAEWGMALSSRNVTVSTVGLMKEVEQFMLRSDCNLTLSLFSPFSDERKKYIPAENRNPVQKIVNAMQRFPVKKKRRLSLAYIMIEGLNDTDSHLEALKSILKGSSVRVNLLPYHSVGNDSNSSSSGERMQFFKHNLIISGVSASIRKSRGRDISAACGLLASGLNQS
jgi:23S rRNA (adenine2503-C2)-methyltransferase